MIPCEICKENGETAEFKDGRGLSLHLRAKHNMKFDEYKIKYQDKKVETSSNEEIIKKKELIKLNIGSKLDKIKEGRTLKHKEKIDKQLQKNLTKLEEEIYLAEGSIPTKSFQKDLEEIDTKNQSEAIKQTNNISKEFHLKLKKANKTAKLQTKEGLKEQKKQEWTENKEFRLDKKRVKQNLIEKLSIYGIVALGLGVLFTAGAFFTVVLSQFLLPMGLILIPIICALIPTFFFLLYWMDIKKLAPEAIIFKQARKLRQKGIPSAIIRVFHGDNAIKYGLGKKQKTGDEITYHINQYGIKYDPTQLPSIATEHTFDGVPIMNFSPIQPCAIDGTSAVAIQELFENIRKKYTELNYMSDLALSTLLGKEHNELIQDAHCFVDENDNITELDLVKKIEEIQKTEGDRILKLNPGGRFFVYNKAFSVINNAHTSQLLQQFEMLVKRLAIANQDKFDFTKILVFAFAALMVMVGGGVALNLAGVI